MRQRLILLFAVVVATAGLTACGSKEAVVHHVDTEAGYVDVGPEGGPYLKYQVQVSRQLGPGDFQNVAAHGDPARVDPEDSEYLRGLPPATLKLAANPQNPIEDEIYFGVFIAAYNPNKVPLKSAALSGFVIHDSLYQEGAPDAAQHTFQPVASPDPRNPPNPFLYKQATVPAHVGSGSGTLPLPDSPAGTSTTAAELLLFKIPQAALENRPLVLQITGPDGGKPATISLDV